MARRLSFETDGRDWPNREASRFVAAGGLRWHVQVMGEGPVLLLVHGTGASTHSWRDLAPLLARHFRVVASDLPGHGFTQAPPPDRLSLPEMARALAALVRALDVEPALAAGHSAGAAVLARMCLDGAIRPRALVALNGALLPLHGLAGRVFSPVARLLATTPIASRLFARRAGAPGAVERLVENTGSRLDRRGVELYGRLTGNAGHVAAALGMMAAWDLRPLERELPRLEPRLFLVVGGADRAIPPDTAIRVADRVPGARVEYLRGLGHLAHEERPEEVAALILGIARSVGIEVG